MVRRRTVGWAVGVWVVLGATACGGGSGSSHASSTTKDPRLGAMVVWMEAHTADASRVTDIGTRATTALEAGDHAGARVACHDLEVWVTTAKAFDPVPLPFLATPWNATVRSAETATRPCLVAATATDTETTNRAIAALTAVGAARRAFSIAIQNGAYRAINGGTP